MIDVLSRILDYAWDLLPRPVIVGPTERGVFFFLGRYGRVLGPGLYIQCEILEPCDIYCCVSQLVETSILPVVTSDGKSYQLRFVVEYEIEDPMLYHLSQHDGQLQAELQAGSTAISTISSLSSEQFEDMGIRKICKIIRSRIRDSLEGRGVNVLSVRCVMRDRCRSFFLSHAERLAD